MPNHYASQLNALREEGLWRAHHVRETSQSRFVYYQGKRYLNFNSNDYLGLSTDPRLIEAAKVGMNEFGLGSGSANTLSGYTVAHEKLCHTLSAWLKRDKVLLFSSGYQANMAMLTALVQPKDFIAADKHNHASLIDGMRMTGAEFKRYAHLNQISLQKMLEKTNKRTFMVTESVFSMEGDSADLSSLSKISQEKSATLLVDEAHAFGLYGSEGQGKVFEVGLSQNDVPVIMGTFGKALGVSGAMLAGRADEMDMIMQCARPYLFTTALSPMIATAVNCAIECVKKSETREHLFSLVTYFKENIKSMELSVFESHSPIQSLLCHSIEEAKRWGDALKEKSIWVPVIRYPTVPIESPRLRFTFNALHTKSDVDILLTALDEVRCEKTF